MSCFLPTHFRGLQLIWHIWDFSGQKKKMSCFWKPYRPCFLEPTLSFLGHLRIFLLFLVYFEWFSRFFLYIKFSKKKKIVYLPTLKNTETFPEIRHLFFFASSIFGVFLIIFMGFFSNTIKFCPTSEKCDDVRFLWNQCQIEAKVW